MCQLSRKPVSAKSTMSGFEAQEDDKWLLTRVAAHDANAFETFYARYGPSLRSYLKRHLQGYDLVDEVFNDVMLVIWQRTDARPDQVHPAAWLYGIAKNKARKARQYASRPTPPSSLLAKREEPSPERGLLHREQHETVTRVLDTLPPAQRTVIEMLVYEGSSYKDIATRTGETINTVKTRIWRARQRFAKHAH